MELHSLLRELGGIMGIGSIGLDAQGTCRLIFDKTLVVDLEPTADEKLLHMIATVGPMPADGDGRLLRSLLSANFMGQDTGNAALALDELNNEIVLCQRIALDSLDVNGFVVELEAFVNRLEDWKQRLASGKLRTSPPADDLQRPQGPTPFPVFA